MKIGLILALVLSVSSGPSVDLDDSSEVVPQSLVDYINSVQSSWVSSKDWVGSMTISQARSLASSIQTRDESIPEYDWGSLLNHITAPTNFDSRVQWPNCIHPIRDQGQCGSCWAFAASESLSDRACISSNGAVNVVLSPQFLVDCNTDTASGCNGGGNLGAWQYMQRVGIPLESCIPYMGVDQTCPSRCLNGSPLVLYKATNVALYSNPASIQAAVMSAGPLEVCFTLYQDFYSYKSGVYVHTSGAAVGGHCVKLLGWGVSGSTNYWICANSWGTGWGMQGYFWIAFGQCGLDSNGCAGSPVV